MAACRVGGGSRLESPSATAAACRHFIGVEQTRPLRTPTLHALSVESVNYYIRSEICVSFDLPRLRFFSRANPAIVTCELVREIDLDRPITLRISQHTQHSDRLCSLDLQPVGFVPNRRNGHECRRSAAPWCFHWEDARDDSEIARALMDVL